MNDVSVKVSGLAAVDRAFRGIDRSLQAELKSELLDVAEGVATDVRSRMPRRKGRAAASVKARASGRRAAIAAGGRAAPYFQWLDFGGSVGRGHRPGVAWSGAIKREWMGVPVGEGRYLYPGIRAKRKDIEQGAGDAVLNAAAANGFETRGR